MHQIDDIITTARLNVEERERKAAARRLSHEAMIGRPSLWRRIARFGRGSGAIQTPRNEPEATPELDPLAVRRKTGDALR